ncbi:trigger factor [Peptoniphilus catoniae]|uniref:trigger factor n=1 Tax=Peptoniphilus catoniae TaxID=1660341 RepID=UPI0010FE5155|nr:trigger factor [Peptoniphilus catoniae]
MTDIKKKENNTVFFDIVLDAQDLKKAQDEVFIKNRKYFQVPGFRKGKVPRKIIENMYGKDVFMEDAINEILPSKYEETVDELKLEVVDQPNIDIKEANQGEDVTVEVSVDVKPEVKLGEYKGIEVEDVKYEVTDELIDKDLENQRQMNARRVNVDDRPAKEKDKVNIDFKGKIDGEEFEGGSAEKQDLELGSNTFIPGFEDQIIGHKVGEEFEIDVTFPEDYASEDLKGKDAKFEIKLNTISYDELPELDDEFIKDISDFDTVEEYRQDLKEKREKEFEHRERAEKENKILERIVEEMEVDVPQGMVNHQIDMQMQNFDQSLRAQGMSLEDYIKMIGSNVDAFRENLKDDALRQVKTSLAIEAVAKAEKIDATEEEVTAEIDRMVEEYFPDEEDKKAKMKEQMAAANKEGIKENLLNRKALDFLVENAKFVEAKEEKESEEDNKEEK